MFGSNRGILPASVWMVILGILLGWLPFIGPAIAGVLGGMQAGTVVNAVAASIIPSLLVAGLILLVGALFDAPVLGALLGIGAFMVLVMGSLPLVGGAWVGGMLSERRMRGGES